MSHWKPAYVALGSNLDEPRRQVERARALLRELPVTRVVAESRLYGARALGDSSQPDFVNAATGLLTQLEALPLLHELRGIEQRMGRPAARKRWAARVIDLDLLAHARERRQDSELTLPHPGLAERNFVLYPLADIAPDLDVPGLGRVAELKARVSSDGIWAL